jgi:hypothetical protein
VTNLYDEKPLDCSSIEKDVSICINLYLKRDALPMSIGRFNSRAPQCSMLVQTDLSIEGCLMEDNVGSTMVIHMDRYGRLMKGLLNVYAICGVYQTTNLCLVMKSCKFHVRSSSDLLQKCFVGFVGHPELQYDHLVQVSDDVCKMMNRVAVSQP